MTKRQRMVVIQAAETILSVLNKLEEINHEGIESDLVKAVQSLQQLARDAE